MLGPQPFPDLLLVEGYTVETGILDGMDETYKMFALFQRERIDSLSCALRPDAYQVFGILPASVRIRHMDLLCRHV